MLLENTKGVHLWLVLWKAFKSMEGYDKKSIDALDLCLSDFAVLEVLLHKGPLPVNIIGKKILLTSGSISTAVDRLEKRSLVSRRICPEDARVTLVNLTDKGHRLIDQAFHAHEDRMEKAVSSLSIDEKSTLVYLLKKLGTSVPSLNP